MRVVSCLLNLCVENLLTAAGCLPWRRFAGGCVPDAGLHFANVGAAQQQHAQAALADAAADGVRQLTVQYGLVEGQGAAVVAAAMVSCLSMLSGLTRMPMLLSS